MAPDRSQPVATAASASFRPKQTVSGGSTVVSSGARAWSCADRPATDPGGHEPG
jgi:hypothetical protein